MRAWSRWLLTVRHPGREVRRRGRVLVLFASLQSLLAVAGAPFTALTIDNGYLAFPVVAGVVAGYAAMIATARRGRVDLAAVGILATYVLAVLAGTVLGGAAASLPVFMVGFVSLAGILLPRRALLPVLLVALGTTLAAPLAVGGRTRGLDYTEVLVYSCLVGGFAALVAAVNKWVTDHAFDDADAERLRAREQQRRAEDLAEALRVANTDLERRVAERTAELSSALTRYEALAEQLAELSARDHLTGLANRRRLDTELDRLRGEDPHGTLALAVTDLDDFKRVNDTFGHQVGDVVLQRVADVLRQVSRRGDVAARMGGEEFVLLMPATTAEEAVARCERLRRGVAALSFDDVVPGLRVTTSTGVAQAGPDGTCEDLLRRADALLYEAKRSGKNRVAGALQGTRG
ncbi:hypothetical protein NUM3379_15190 [Kineococcus sp. NUM-3379]